MADHQAATAPKSRKHIWLILDESGSMESTRKDVIGGFNAYIEDRKTELDIADIFVTVTKFNTSAKALYSNVPVQDVVPLSLTTYTPGGGTALMDAVGNTLLANEKMIGMAVVPQVIQEPSPDASTTVESTTVEAAVVKSTPNDSDPSVAGSNDAVLVVVFTDGEENSSREFRSEQIKQMIADRTAQGTHTFIYLGADHDAWSASSDIGISANNTVSYSKGATTQAFSSLSQVSKRYVSGYQEDYMTAQGLAPGGSVDDMFTGYKKADGGIADEETIAP